MRALSRLPSLPSFLRSRGSGPKPNPSPLAAAAARWLPVLLGLAVLGYGLLAAWLLSGHLDSAAPLPWAVPLRPGLALLALTPLALSAGCAWFLVKSLRSRSRQLSEADEAARESARGQAVALRTMSHELRTSLSAMAGFSDLLDQTGLTAAQAEHLACIRDNTTHLLSVVNRVLEYGKLEAGRVELHEDQFEVDDLVRACLKSVSLLAARKGLALVFHVPKGAAGRLQGDATRIRQVLLNLLSNAVKFTPRGTVSVTVWPGAETGGQVTLHFQVRDTGVGIHPRDLIRLFRPFSQVGAPDQGGTGLGLAISRQLCRRMGGDLVAESRPGEGSTFTATIQVRAAPALPTAPLVRLTEAAAPLPAPVPGSGLAILLVEDNAMNQRLGLKVLEALGHTATVAGNGARAVEMARLRRYDVILMDVHMPVMDGLLAARTLRRVLPADQRPYIIGLTADALPGDRERCLRAGMDEHLTKPMDGERLTVLLDAMRLRTGPRATAREASRQGLVAGRSASAQAEPF